MALIKCNECGHMISDKASKCPKCGAVVNEANESAPKANKQVASLHQPVQNDRQASKSHIFRYVILALVALLITGGAIWYFSFRDAASSNEEIAEYKQSTSKDNNGNGVENTNLHDNQDKIFADSLSADETETEELGECEVKLKGTCDGTPIQFVLQLKGEVVESGEYKNLDSGTKMKVSGTWEGKRLNLTGYIQDVAYVFDMSCSTDLALAYGTAYYGTLNITWPTGEKNREVELTVTE